MRGGACIIGKIGPFEIDEIFARLPRARDRRAPFLRACARRNVYVERFLFLLFLPITKGEGARVIWGFDFWALVHARRANVCPLCEADKTCLRVYMAINRIENTLGIVENII